MRSFVIIRLRISHQQALRSTGASFAKGGHMRILRPLLTPLWGLLVLSLMGATVLMTVKEDVGTTLPATCHVGDRFFKTDAPPGQNTYGCVAEPGTWALQGDGVGTGGGGGGGGGASTPGGDPGAVQWNQQGTMAGSTGIHLDGDKVLMQQHACANLNTNTLLSEPACVYAT